MFASLQNALSNDYGIEHSIEYLKDQVLEEIIGNSKFYVRFTECGTKKEMLEKIQAYFKHKVFTLAEVDVVVLAASTALNVNLYILSCNRLADSITLTEAPAQGSAQSVILKYNRSGSSYHGFDHYQPIVKIKNVTELSNVTNRLSSAPIPEVFDKLSACPPHPSLPTNNQPNNLSLDMISTSSAPTTLPSAHVMPQPGTLAKLADPSANSQPLLSLCTSAAADSISGTLVTGPSLPMEESIEHTFSGDGTLSEKPPSSSKLSQHLSQAMPNAKSDITQGMTSNQQQAVKETAVHEEVILRDIVEGCSDDHEGNYFDEYGGGVFVKSSIDLSHAIISEPTSEEIISLAEFIGNNVDNTPFLPSQEPSDDEQYTKPDMSAIHDDSEHEITEIPLEFHISPTEKKGKYMKTMPNYVKLAQLPV